MVAATEIDTVVGWESTVDIHTAIGTKVYAGVGTMEDVPIALDTETTPPQDRRKGVAISSVVEKFRVTTTYKRKNVGHRSSIGRLSQLTRKEGMGDPHEDYGSFVLMLLPFFCLDMYEPYFLLFKNENGIQIYFLFKFVVKNGLECSMK